MDAVIQLVAKYFIILSLLIAVAAFWRAKDRQARIRFIALLILGGVLSVVLAAIGKMLVNDPRPFVVDHTAPLIAHAADNGFPSDHTLLTSFIGWACLTVSLDLGIMGLIVAALVGSARVLAGVHHWEDVIGSFVITGISTFIAFAVIRRIMLRRGRKQPIA